MKVNQITPGLIPIPPNGWGAVEKIIWEYKTNLDNIGCETNIIYLNEIPNYPADINHIHMANLAIDAKERGMPYVFSIHDHHVVHYGKDSFKYKETLDAIKGSIISFCHAEYLVDYFDETDKLFFLSHGVDTKFFKNDNPIKSEHKLLCIANNGLAGDSTFDRKGFRYAIESAKKLNLPITIAGPENNQLYFDANKDLLEYNKLNLLLNNPTEDEIKELYNTHSIFLHPSSLEAGHPNLTILEALSSGVPVVGCYDGSQNLGGLIRCDRDVNNIVDKIEYVITNYQFFVEQSLSIRNTHDWAVIVNRMYEMFNTIINIKKNYTSKDIKKLYIEEFGLKEIELIKTTDNITFNNYFIDGCFFEVLGTSKKTYTIKVYDEDNNLYFTEKISANNWIKTNRKYFTKWVVELYDNSNNNLIYRNALDYTNKRVYIAFDSSSLGDTLAWIPYVEEFRKLHNCHIICSTFKNDLFKSVYTNIEFVEPGTRVENITGMYTIGWFYDNNLEPVLPNTIPLQKTITNILGLDYHEIKPEINQQIGKRPIPEKYIAIATTSTSQLKYWNYPGGWQKLSVILLELGYKILHISKEKSNISNITELKDKSIQSTINAIYHSEFVIGLSSGLSWLSWAIGKKVIMIANFTNEEHEFTSNCYRVVNKNVCNSCWNSEKFKFDKSDWNWCPLHKNTERQFECSKLITPSMVMEQVFKIIN